MKLENINHYYLAIALFIFHYSISVLLYFISYSEFLSFLHNSQGVWYVTRDVAMFHEQAIRVADYFSEGKIGLYEFLKNRIPDIYNSNSNIKWQGLLYWITGVKKPIIFIIITSTCWPFCIILCKKTFYY